MAVPAADLAEIPLFASLSEDELHEGQQLLVKVINVDPSGKIRLSRRAVLREERGEPEEEYQPPPDHDGRGDRPRGPRPPSRGGDRRPPMRGRR